MIQLLNHVNHVMLNVCGVLLLLPMIVPIVILCYLGLLVRLILDHVSVLMVTMILLLHYVLNVLIHVLPALLQPLLV